MVSLAVAVATLFAGTNAAKTTATDFPALFLTGINDDVPTTRVLRTADGEEKAVSGSTTSKLVTWLVSPKSAEVKLTLAEKYRVGKWVLENMKSEYVFKRLGLDGGLDNVLTDSKLRIYAAYIDRFNKKTPKNTVTMVDKFTHTYGDDAVVKLIQGAMTTPSTQKIAIRLRNDLLNSWVSKEKTAEDIFTLLKLDTAGNKLFTAPQMTKDSSSTFSLYAAFVDRFNQQNPTKGETLVDLFTKTYGDEAVARMVEMGINVPSTEKVARRLRYELLSKWEEVVEPDEAIFKLLKLDKAGSDLFVTPQLNTWYEYTKMIYSQLPEEIMVPILTAHYGYDGLSKIFKYAQPEVTSMRFLAVKLETAMEKMRVMAIPPQPKVDTFAVYIKNLDVKVTNFT